MPSSSTTSDPMVPVPVPSAVDYFKARWFPQSVVEAVCAAGDAERELARLRPLGSVEDAQDYETVLVGWHCAVKVLASAPSRRPLIGGA